ncbi:MAG TPA: sigma-54-dependent Fis family transcriptional regulator [Bacteroidetes bacterium]|nr:sigma-54-dependent Fis family transcriptional regulator [Bacteroidota bacterium]
MVKAIKGMTMSTQATRQVLRQLTTRFGIVGESPSMVAAISRLLQVAPTDLTVLITGETGTGKEVFAHAVHELSQRKKFPFVSVNCGAIPETLLESELFGAEKGAYTGSVEQRKGFFESAHRGTIFLDEIGEMPIGTQVKLLRILESGEFSRLGSSDVQKVDVRIIAATNRDLLYEVRRGTFRQDLFFRLNSVNIHLPPLRQHPDDVPALVEYFAERTAERIGATWAGVDEDAMDLLQRHPWHGNVRELRNIVETMVTLEHGARVTTDILHKYLQEDEDHDVIPPTALARMPEPVRPSSMDADMQTLYRTLLQLTSDVNEIKLVLRHLMAMSINQGVMPQGAGIPVPPSTHSPISSSTDLIPIVDPSLSVRPTHSQTSSSSGLPTLNIADLERIAIVEALRRAAGVRKEAARLLNMSERTLYRKIEDYGIS